MTEEQAGKIVQGIFDRFPRAYLSDGVKSAWAGSLKPFDFEFAVANLRHPVRSAAGEYPPPLNVLRKILEDKQRAAQKGPESTHEAHDATRKHLRDSAHTSAATKHVALINYLQSQGERHRFRPLKFDGFRKGGRRRIEKRLVEKYGDLWWEPDRWEFGHDKNGRLVPVVDPKGSPCGAEGNG